MLILEIIADGASSSATKLLARGFSTTGRSMVKKCAPEHFLVVEEVKFSPFVLVALVTVGKLPVDQIVAAKDYALAEAARPFLGKAGFTLIAVAAMLSTASAINATLYGAARLSYCIARDGNSIPLIGGSK